MKPFNEQGAQAPELEVGDYGFHGDVIIERVSTVPENFNELPVEPKGSLAYGEVTGHCHKLIGDEGVDYQLRYEPEQGSNMVQGATASGNVLHLRVLRPTALKHQEHSPILLPPGDYRIGFQEEFDPFEEMMRRVID